MWGLAMGLGHFHIVWTFGTSTRIDWERFANPQDADRVAKLIVRPLETYKVVEFDDGCQRCAVSRLGRKIVA
jgi:hypothetical protein